MTTLRPKPGFNPMLLKSGFNPIYSNGVLLTS